MTDLFEDFKTDVAGITNPLELDKLWNEVHGAASTHPHGSPLYEIAVQQKLIVEQRRIDMSSRPADATPDELMAGLAESNPAAHQAMARTIALNGLREQVAELQRKFEDPSISNRARPSEEAITAAQKALTLAETTPTAMGAAATAEAMERLPQGFSNPAGQAA